MADGTDPSWPWAGGGSELPLPNRIAKQDFFEGWLLIN